LKKVVGESEEIVKLYNNFFKTKEKEREKLKETQN